MICVCSFVGVWCDLEWRTHCGRESWYLQQSRERCGSWWNCTLLSKKWQIESQRWNFKNQWKSFCGIYQGILLLSPNLIYHTIWTYQKFRTNFKYLLVSFRSSITTIIILTAWRKVNWYQTQAAVHCSLIFQEFAAKFDIYMLFNRENMTTPKSMQYMLWKAQLKVIHFNI